jgi:hypothetical protein
VWRSRSTNARYALPALALLVKISLAASTVHHRVGIPITASATIRIGGIGIVQASGSNPVTIEGSQQPYVSRGLAWGREPVAA